MNIHRNARLTPLGRERLARQIESGQKPEAGARAAGVRPRTARKWWGRRRAEGVTGLRDRSSRPHRLHRPTPDAIVALIDAVPYKIHTIPTDNGIQFRFAPRYANGPTARYATHMFDMRCRENGIEHRFTKINRPWTNGQVERMNRTIKEATVKRYHYDSHEQLRRHLADFVDACNFGRRLKTLKGLAPYEFICRCWTNEPDRFNLDPLHQMPGLNT